ncbi:MAG: DSD1 family PLP-dependent enzyme [Candidatus Latescibacterota bacterium]
MANSIGISKDELDTPCLVVDIDRFQRNIFLAGDMVHAAGKHLRPHAKTHKCSVIAHKQIEKGAIGICAAKVSEAEALAQSGVRGILVTGPVATSLKANRLLDVRGMDPSLIAVVDSIGGVRLLEEAAACRGLTLDVLVDMDVGQGRTGTLPGDVPALADYIHASSALRLRGVQAYAGQVQHLPDREKRRNASLEALSCAAEVYRGLASQYECDIFTGGGTGTFDIDTEIPELTELQLGSYIFMDAEYLDIGWKSDAASFLPSLTLLATVVSANRRGYVTIDAGLKALYRDGGTPRVVRLEGPGWRYEWFGDEYGKLIVPEGAPAPQPGDRVELVVSHCDPTVNLFDRMYAVRNGLVEEIWEIDLRGMSQ